MTLRALPYRKVGEGAYAGTFLLVLDRRQLKVDTAGAATPMTQYMRQLDFGPR